MELVMNAAQIGEVISLATGRDEAPFVIDEIEPGRLVVRLPFQQRMLRPGGTLSGPALFTAADLAMWVAVMAHYGPVVAAVTANLSINFLSRGEPGDILAEVRLLKKGRRLAVMDIGLFSAADPKTRIAHVTGSYAIPPEAPSA